MMSGDGLSKKEQKALQQMAQAVMQQLAAGRAAKDVVRDLEANGWLRDDAVEFVGQMEQQWQEVAESPEAQTALYFQSRFPDMRAVRSAPSLFAINGFGTSLYGTRDHDPESSTYVKTHTICLLFVPVLALGAYRVAKAESGEGWHLIGKVPLSTFAKAWNLLAVSVVVALIGYGGWLAHTSSDAYRAERKLTRADEAAASGDPVTASRLYCEVATTRTEHASTARRSLEQLLGRPELAKLPVADAVDVFRCVAGIGGVSGAFEHGLALVRKHAKAAPVDSARLLQAIALLSPNEACDVLAELLDGPLGNLSAEDTVTILRTAAEMSQKPAHRESLLAWGMNWLEEHPQADPRGTLTLLALLAESPAADLAAIDAARRRQWERIVADEPDSVEAAVQLALLLQKEGDADRIETLLTPHRDKLGTGEGARLLGQLLAAKGAFDESYALLSPYMEKRLGELHVAQEAFGKAIVQAQERAISRLQTGAASGFDYSVHENATEDQQQAMVGDYLSLQVKDDAGVAAARERLIRHAAIVPVALDLGMVTLRRAENMTDADARRAELKKAEETFLAIQGMAGDTDAYRLHLGQVYYWLGKHEEGHKLFEELLTSHDRGYEILMAVANVLRDLGAAREVRQLLEEAYGKADDDPQRHGAAYVRAITPTDQQDKITWLERCNQNTPEVKADLCVARGDQAAAEAKDDEAAEHYREAIAICGRLAETESMLNNGGLVYLSLFEVTGDRESLTRGIEWLEKAIALSPGDPIVLSNSAAALMRVAVQDLAGEELDLRRLQKLEAVGVLDALATDRNRLEQLRRNVRDHAGLAKALSYLDKAMVLAPKRIGLYGNAMRIHMYVRDEEALQQLSRRIDAAELDLTESNEEFLDHYCFNEDAVAREKAQSLLARMEALVKEYREGPKGPGFAVAVANLMGSKLTQTDLSAVDADELVQLAEEAHKAAPSLETYSLLSTALLFRASRTLEAAHPEYAKAVERIHRSLPASYTVVLALARDDRLGESARDNRDVRRVAELLLQKVETFPDSLGPWTCALLRTAYPARADELARTVADDQVSRLTRKITLQLCPVSAAVACTEYWARIAAGEEETAQLPLKQVAQFGAPIPFALLDGGVETGKDDSTSIR